MVADDLYFESISLFVFLPLFFSFLEPCQVYLFTSSWVKIEHEKRSISHTVGLVAETLVWRADGHYSSVIGRICRVTQNAEYYVLRMVDDL